MPTERLRRFRLEAELLGRLQHPGIAQIFEAGLYHEAGRGEQPYFAMELVDGVDIATYCTREGLTVEQRLELLAKVCAAVQHAHDRGIIHRDLKPDNVLVLAGGQPKVLDFGVARASNAGQVLSTVCTEEGALVGTLAYMAPEQLYGEPEQVTPAVDVFALGVLAFELLSGRLPHPIEGLPISAAIARLSSAQAPELSRIEARWKGDVSTIVGKALESEPGRRYSSPAALGDDLRRFLDRLPIQARPPSRAYRLRKWVARNRGLASGLAVAFLALAAGLVAALVFAAKESEQRKLAFESDSRARQSEAGLLEMVLASARRAQANGDYASAREVLDSVQEDRRGFGWRLFDQVVPQVMPLDGHAEGLFWPDRGGDQAVWQFLGEDRLLSLQRGRAGLQVYDLERGTHSVLLPAMEIDSIGRPTRSGRLVVRQGRQALVLDLVRAVVLECIPVEPPDMGWLAPGHCSEDGRVVVVRQGMGGYSVRVDGIERFHWQRELSIPRNGYMGEALVAPDGRRAFLNWCDETWVFDVPLGTVHACLPEPGYEHVFATGLDTGEWAAFSWRARPGDESGWHRILQGSDGSGGLPGFAVPGRRAEWSADGSIVAVGVWEEAAMQLRDGRSGEALPWHPALRPDGSLPIPDAWWCAPLLSPAGETLLLMTQSGPMWRLDLMEDRPAAVQQRLGLAYRGHHTVVYHAALSPDGALVASLAPVEDSVHLWDAQTGELLARLARTPVDTASRDALMAFSEDGHSLVLTSPGEQGSEVQILHWDLTSGRRSVLAAPVGVQEGNHLPLLDAFIQVLQPGPRQRLGLKAQMGGARAWAAWWAYEDVEFRTQPEFHGGERWSSVPEPGVDLRWEARAVAVHPHKDEVAVVSRHRAVIGSHGKEGRLVLRSLPEGTVLRTIDLKQSPYCVAWSPDGATLAVGNHQGTITLIDAQRGTVQHEFRAHGSYVYSLVWFPDGQRLLSVSGDHSARIWDARPRAERRADA
ncbi:MAG: serine/threonine-protein kinase [Planctomycetota bacterium]